MYRRMVLTNQGRSPRQHSRHSHSLVDRPGTQSWSGRPAGLQCTPLFCHYWCKGLNWGLIWKGHFDFRSSEINRGECVLQQFVPSAESRASKVGGWQISCTWEVKHPLHLVLVLGGWYLVFGLDCTCYLYLVLVCTCYLYLVLNCTWGVRQTLINSRPQMEPRLESYCPPVTLSSPLPPTFLHLCEQVEVDLMHPGRHECNGPKMNGPLLPYL